LRTKDFGLNDSKHSVNLLFFSFHHEYLHLLSKDLKIIRYGTIILPLVLHGRETCSLTLREGEDIWKQNAEDMFGSKRNSEKLVVTWGSRKLH